MNSNFIPALQKWELLNHPAKAADTTEHLDVYKRQEWKALDTFAEPGRDYTQGKFGFLIQGNDEIAISDFKFQPR